MPLDGLPVRQAVVAQLQPIPSALWCSGHFVAVLAAAAYAVLAAFEPLDASPARQVGVEQLQPALSGLSYSKQFAVVEVAAPVRLGLFFVQVAEVPGSLVPVDF